MQILIIYMQISVPDDEKTGLTNSIGINKCYGEGYAFKLVLFIANNTAKLRIAFHIVPLGSPINCTFVRTRPVTIDLVEPNSQCW